MELHLPTKKITSYKVTFLILNNFCKAENEFPLTGILFVHYLCHLNNYDLLNLRKHVFELLSFIYVLTKTVPMRLRN